MKSTSKAAVQYPKVDALTLVGDDLNAMVGEIHDELQSELKSDIELSEMSKWVEMYLLTRKTLRKSWRNFDNIYVSPHSTEVLSFW